jgi:hypothetical protein
VPDKILNEIFAQAGKDRGHIPIKGTVNKIPYQQTLVKYAGSWRLYINTTMLKNSPDRIGEPITITVVFDPSDRTLTPHPKLTKALNKNKKAKAIFEALAPYLKKEIVRYISGLKTDQSIDKNITKAIKFLLGKQRFIGRDKP